MDFPVEATVHLNIFRDETEVREILRSHGFGVTDLSGNRVRVKGSFLKLKAVKARLEQLLNSQSQTKTRPYSSPPVQTVSSGAVPKYYTNNSSVSDGKRDKETRQRSGDKPLHASPSSPYTSASLVANTSHNHPNSPESRAFFSPRADQHAPFRHGSESFVVDADVFRYAERLRKKDIDIILENHNVKIEVYEFGDSASITLLGKSARIAISKLQSLMNDLSQSLCTQEVPWKDMDHEGEALLERIRKDNVYNSVLVCEMKDRLHLVGPSEKSYELKQQLLGRPHDQPQRTGRTFKKDPRTRSSSRPPVDRKNTERDSGAIANPSPVGDSGYVPSKYQDNKQEWAKPERGAGARLGQSGALPRSNSESREKQRADRGSVQETGNNRKLPETKQGLKQLLFVSPKDIKQKTKGLRR
ncbi:uncharacterized protein si:dkey-154b15.1 [Xiphias gladius]|uniref:uncharacterized protein si:dkey-154b15.1 n=1 Tax=Xiphias gladius TaxID=8245 RepID=UPI001A98D58B|nr:uncharacterized protein si:dkey-154b15.1 [Xiphias gladius]XP_039977014.1 uncharacterized protein si:dkey-154b15.1 [Xiphias gladius]